MQWIPLAHAKNVGAHFAFSFTVRRREGEREIEMERKKGTYAIRFQLTWFQTQTI